MRCPKCGYITFDHMETCLKCKKNITGTSESAGTTYHAEAPSFLRVPKRDDDVEEFETESFVEDDDIDESSFEFSDPDLNALADKSDDFVFTDAEDDEEGIAFDTDSVDLEGDEFQLESDDEAVLDLDEDPLAPSFAVPDELSDISDLAPPSQEAESDMMDLDLDEDLSATPDMDLDSMDLDLDLNLGLGDAVKTEIEVDSLSLDDIDLSEEEIGTEDSDLDDLDMNLDLELGAPGNEPDTNKTKSSGSLDDLSLSLD